MRCSPCSTEATSSCSWTDRQALDAIEQALTELTRAADDVTALAPGTIGALAHRLGVRPATLRRWERAQLLRPGRDRTTGYRIYGPADTRDAHIVHQLRRSGYLLAQIRPLLDELRDTASSRSAASALSARRDRLGARARAMLHASAEIERLLHEQ
ncbi:MULTISPECIES: MerR family transcriptional regulator [Pseudonocardia]|uniref:HTH merR-type domain-containing protein n=1 Tax=Pseudonocardia saturnea TaxID=33909 RepID=A0ABQ0RW27_9PSEU|nr:hypothetical protein Pdca_46350 [Pseudonocardia autotrophica]GEC24846.1 hypothetical protein PSA01_18750 [Pseudonocardia saturnea]